MKIVLANYRYFVSGGPEIYMFNVKRLLEEAGHTVIPQALGVCRAHVANADDAEANLLHPDFLLGTGYFLVLPKLPETSMAASTSSLWRDVLRFSFSSFKNSSSSTGSETV